MSISNATSYARVKQAQTKYGTTSEYFKRALSQRNKKHRLRKGSTYQHPSILNRSLSALKAQQTLVGLHRNNQRVRQTLNIQPSKRAKLNITPSQETINNSNLSEANTELLEENGPNKHLRQANLRQESTELLQKNGPTNLREATTLPYRATGGSYSKKKDRNKRKTKLNKYK
jgi:hypothetical protein